MGTMGSPGTQREPLRAMGLPLLRNIQEDREVRIGRLGRLDGLAKYPIKGAMVKSWITLQ
jgi:hypothetical protein